MAQLAHFERTFLDSAGNPISGATIEIYGQGSTIVSGGNTVFVVDDPGSFQIGDSARLINGDGTDPAGATRLISAASLTGITVSGAGFSGTANNDRLINTSLIPSTFKDVNGDEASGTLLTNAQGYVSCWLVGQPIDVRTSGGTSALGAAAAHVWFDVQPEGGDSSSSNLISGTLYKRNTLRALAATDIFIDYSAAGVNKFKVMGDGEIVAGAAGATHNLTGTLTVSGVLTSAALAATTGTFSGAVSGTTGTFSGAMAGTSGTFTSGITVTGNSTITGSLTAVTALNCEAIFHPVPTLAVNDTTPAVSQGTVFAENNTVPTSITDFDPHNNGQEITIIINTTNTTFVDGATLQMAGGVNFNPNGNDVITFVEWNGVWYEKSRSAN